MTQWQHRLFIFADEWLGVLLLLYLYGHAGRDTFVIVFFIWAIAIYGVSYPFYWKLSKISFKDAVEKIQKLIEFLEGEGQ